MHDILLTSLRELGRQHTLTTLGDRSSYLGASDIGSCPRKVIMDRLRPCEHDLATLLRFQRGHMAEHVVAKAMSMAGYEYERQTEIDIAGEIPLKVHIDFVFTSEVRKYKSILEVKSVSGIPEQPYASWESQLYLQMGALSEQFSGHLIKGAILALDMGSGEAAFFNSYAPNATLYQGLQERAASIWTDYQTLLENQQCNPATEPGPLCGHCHHLTDCPRFQAQEVPDMAGFVQELREMQEKEKRLKNKIEPFKANLFEIVEKIGSIRVNGTVLAKATRTRKNFNMEKLKSFLTEHGRSVHEFQEESTYSFLDIKHSKAA